MKRIITILCLAACLQGAWAQNAVENIRQRYNAMKELIASHSGEADTNGADNGTFYHLTGTFNLPATGFHTEDTYLYFEDEEDPTEEKIYLPHRLTFATTRYNFAPRVYYEEYLYDADGRVAFIYAYDPMMAFDDDEQDMQYEFRFYMEKGRVVKTIVRKKSYDEEAFRDVWQGNQLPKKYERAHSSLVANAAQLATLFKDIEKRTYSYAE